MIEIIIDGLPVAWKAHGGYGKRAFNPRFKEKSFYQWQIKAQYNRESPISGPVKVVYSFFMPVPKGTSFVRKKQMLNGIMHPIKRPDLDNLNKFLSDCLKTIAIEDDSQIVDIHSKKLYSEIPKTVIHIEQI